MVLVLSLLGPAHAFDCAGLDPLSCQATLQLVAQIDAELGVGTVRDDHPVARQRPQHVYDRVEAIRTAAAANQCLDGATTIRGTYGGGYDLGARRFSGPWAALDASDFGRADDGVVLVAERAFLGTFVSDLTATAGDLGDVFATYNSAGQVAGNRDDGFLMGLWVRTAGARGFYAVVYGDCHGDPRAAFDGWYDGGLLDGVAIVGLDDAVLDVEIATDTLLDPLATVVFDGPSIADGTLTLSVTGSARVVVPTSPAIGAITGNNSAMVTVDLANAAVADIEAVLRATTVRGHTVQGAVTVDVSIATDAGGPGIGDSRAVDVGPLDLTVGPLGADHTSIPAAVAQVRTTTGATGSTITVSAGDYRANGQIGIADDPDLVGLTLRGAGAGRSAGVDPDPERTATTVVRTVRVLADGSTLDGIDVNMPDIPEDGVAINADDVAVRNCVITRETSATSRSAVYVFLASDGLEMTDCAFSNFGYGAYVPGTVPLVRGNTFTGHGSAGVFLSGTSDGSSSITGNAFADNPLHVSAFDIPSAPLRGNSFEGTGAVRAHLANVDAQACWWGQDTGPLPGQVSIVVEGTVDTSGFLVDDPFPDAP